MRAICLFATIFNHLHCLGVLQQIARAGKGMYIRVDNSNSAQRILQGEIDKLAKADVETTVYTEFDEQFMVVAWIALVLLVLEVLILERKNPLFKNVRLFSDKK